MTQVTKYGRGYKDPNSSLLPIAAYAEGRVRALASGPIAIANGDSIASKHYFGKIASDAILLPFGCVLTHEAVASVTDYDIGIEKDGTVISANVLADGLDISSAGTKSGVAAVAAANVGKRLWEILGLSTDPAVEYDVVGVMNAASSAAKSISLVLTYSRQS